MKNHHMLLTVLSSIFITGCSISENKFSINHPDLDKSRSRIFTVQDPHSEIKCFGDLASTYHEWSDEANRPDINEKFNITILPVLNQTSGVEDDGKKQNLPLDLGTVAQNIASQLGIKYNVIFVPSLQELNPSHNVIQRFFDERAQSANQNVENRIDHKNITIIAAITEYDIVKNNAPVSNIDSRGSVNGKSLSISYGQTRDSYSGRITMMFNTAFFQKVHGYTSNQLTYNPNTFVKVSINFEDIVNSDKIGFSFNGGQPSLGFSYTNNYKDSRYAALDLLLERGLVQVLGKYHNIPYWRCFSENFTRNRNNNLFEKSIHNKNIKEVLSNARKMSGYDSDVEARVRRTFLYSSSNLGLGRYKFRVPEVNASEQLLYLVERDKNSPYEAVQNAPVYPFIVRKDKWNQFNKKYETSKELCSSFSNKQDEEELKLIQQNINSIGIDKDNLEKIKALSQKVSKRKQCINETRIQDFQKTFSRELYEQRFSDEISNSNYIYFDKASLTGKKLLEDLNLIIQERYLLHPNLVLPDSLEETKETDSIKKSQKVSEFFKNIYKSNANDIEKFVILWMYAPYLKDARIYPFYVHRNPKQVYSEKYDDVYAPDFKK